MKDFTKMSPNFLFRMIYNPESFGMRDFTKINPVCGFTDFDGFLMIFDDFLTISINNLRVYP